MFLRTVTIENLRSIERLTFDFTSTGEEGRKWTILLGENGTGKSTVLRAIALLFAGSDALPALLGEPASWVRQGRRTALIEADFATADGQMRKATLRLQAGDTISKVLQRNRTSLKALDRAFSHSGRSYFVVGYGASRRLPTGEDTAFEHRDAFKAVRAQPVSTLFSRGALLRAMDSWAMDLDYRTKSAGRLLSSTLGSLLPGVTFDSIDKAGRRLLFRTPDGLVALQQLSDGYQNMAAWLGDLLFRITETFHDYERPLEARGLLLLDEIDLHLHPVWQRQLLRFIGEKLPNFQVVATTHSPFTAQQAQIGALHVLERVAPTPRAKQTVQARPYLGDPKLLRMEQLLDPLLGIETTESLKSETERERQRTLHAKTRRSAPERAELAGLNASLAALPHAQAVDREEQKRLNLLERIEATLGGKAEVDPVQAEVEKLRAEIQTLRPTKALARQPEKLSALITKIGAAMSSLPAASAAAAAKSAVVAAKAPARSRRKK